MEVGILHVVMMAMRHSAVGVARVATYTAVVFVRMYFARSVPGLILTHFLHVVFFEDLTSLTLWRRSFFIFIFAHPVFKM
jgi:hypothetical protein